MLVVVEGVVDSDVSKRGERHEVERTALLDGLLRNGLVRIVNEVPEPEPVVPVVKRRRRTAEPEPILTAEESAVMVKFADGGLIEPNEPTVD